MVSRSLNADIKRIAHTIIPSLESVFFESRSHIENDIAQDVFPGFVKRQLVYCAAADLSSDGDALEIEFTGLGTSFCMTDASDSKNAVVVVSEDFGEVTGYSYQETIGKNSAFLQGPFTDPEAIARIQTAMRDGRECVELMLNHHKNGDPFWNLLFLLPLKDSDGHLQYWLGAQVNVSECMGSRRDLLQVLNGGQALASENDSITGSLVRSEHSREAAKEVRPRKNSLAHGRRGSKDLSSSRNWFSTFSRKQSIHCPPSPPPIPEGFDSASMSGSKKSKTSQFSSQKFTAKSQTPVYPTPYSCYMVLRCINSGGPTNQRQTTPSARKKHSSKLMVSFYSDAVLDLLSLPSDIAQADIFHLLAETAHSPSVTKTFKTQVRDSLDQGESISAGILLEKSRKRRASTGTGSKRPTIFDLQSVRGDNYEEKRKNSKHDRFWTHWTPLKDAKGNIDWVVLIINSAI
ncbi:hypothetical protein TruAng_000938 [Truncatella angustata]|nr:hypothetical protein TruAng_000938 [Truncatella angustata]